MKIVIANGKHEADFVINMFKDQTKDLIVINSDKNFADYIVRNNKVAVFVGEPYKRFVLEDSGARNADIFIALGEKDTDNYAACMLAKKEFNVKKCICTVTNPKNVDIFKKLGIDSVISSTYLLANSIKSASSLEDVLQTLSIEEDKIVLTEIIINPAYRIANQKIMDCNFPKNATISCIYREPHVIIPNGSTVIKPKDKLLIISTPSEQEKIVKFIQNKK
ncbi:MAG TPA: TrkA family potassium uptake protein [Bacilli bacterium]|jgi:trk system potassium uptake protein TrkA|nr:TrkA family potassium uptake protein [Bacilli bacterium]HOC80926.1 TrkA family potassium uptake protein [Bacilli bacterium]